MSDSHVNDIRYTALWRPVVKAREAPAVSPPLSPSPPPLRAALSDPSLLLFQSHAISPYGAARFPLSFPLGKSIRAVSCSRDDLASGIRRMRTWVRPQILFALMESAERAYALYEGRGESVHGNCVPCEHSNHVYRRVGPVAIYAGTTVFR